MEIRTQSKTGPLVPPLAEIPAKLNQQLDAMKQRWLDQLNRDPASFEIKLPPGEAKHLAPAHSGHRRQPVEREQPIASDVGEERS